MQFLVERFGAHQLLPVSLLLIAWGWVTLFSASAGVGSEPAADQASKLLLQLGGIAAGAVVAMLAFYASPELIRRIGFLAWGASALSLWATLTPLGVEVNGAQRWLSVGPVTLQPLEFAKLGLILGLASWFSQYAHRILDVRYAVIVPGLMIAFPTAAALLQPDFGGSLLLVAFGAALIFLAGARLSHLAVSVAAAIPVLLAIGLNAGYRRDRLEIFWDPFIDPLDRGYQLVQSLCAFGSGGVFGVGLGAGQQKWSFLPEAHTDFILAVIGEELGLVGVTLLLLAFTLLGLCSLGVAARARDLHGHLVAIGAGMLLWFQAAINAGVAMSRLPTTGTTLPLFSYGRSSMIVSIAALGLILHVARPRDAARSGLK